MDLQKLCNQALALIIDELASIQDVANLSFTCKSLSQASRHITGLQYACKNCGEPLFHPKETCRSVQLQDLWGEKGCRTVALKNTPSRVTVGASHTLAPEGLRNELSRAYGYSEFKNPTKMVIRMQNVCCKSCSVVLGLRLCSIHRVPSLSSTPEQELRMSKLPVKEEGHLLLCDRTIRLQGLPKTVAQSRQEQCTVFRCQGRRVPTDTPLGSKLLPGGGCGQPLYVSEDVLGAVVARDQLTHTHQVARLVSHLDPSTCTVGSSREVEQPVGHISIADVHCSRCGEVVGCKILKSVGISGFINWLRVGRCAVFNIQTDEPRQAAPPPPPPAP